ncbi:MAG TPA: dihydroxy-acid dehydratase, partial [Steroidobacteraceae bacterium]|nr:dihydroxy-acid dehydratase [Steroidobacteraceae bacterium]
EGNLGRAVIKTSAVQDAHRVVEAPARIFNDQEEVLQAFKAGRLDCDAVVVVRYQGPRANGMPELHALTPALASLQDRGFHVALVTDGRMSGASGNVPAAIHVTPEAMQGGALARLRDGDVIRLDSHTGVLEAKVTEETLQGRAVEAVDLSANHTGTGRELFGLFRAYAAGAEQGAGVAAYKDGV